MVKKNPVDKYWNPFCVEILWCDQLHRPHLHGTLKLEHDGRRRQAMEREDIEFRVDLARRLVKESSESIEGKKAYARKAIRMAEELKKKKEVSIVTKKSRKCDACIVGTNAPGSPKADWVSLPLLFALCIMPSSRFSSPPYVSRVPK